MVLESVLTNDLLGSLFEIMLYRNGVGIMCNIKVDGGCVG